MELCFRISVGTLNSIDMIKFVSTCWFHFINKNSLEKLSLSQDIYFSDSNVYTKQFFIDKIRKAISRFMPHYSLLARL